MKSRAYLKGRFKKNAIPTETDFADLIEAAVSRQDDGIAKSNGEPLSVEASKTGNRPVLKLYESFSDDGTPAGATPAWVLSLSTGDAGAGKKGFVLSDGDGAARLSIDHATGEVKIDKRLEAKAGLCLLTSSNPIHFTSSWSKFPDGVTNTAEISNDTRDYKTLMIVGNRSNDSSVRRVSIWDRLEVNGNLDVTQTATATMFTARDGLRAFHPQSAGGHRYQIGPFFNHDDFHITHATDAAFQNRAAYLTIRAESGNIGIGTQTPDARLHVTGDARFDGNLTMKGPALAIHHPDSRGTAKDGPRRALIHDTEDTLAVNYAWDYTGGVRISGNVYNIRKDGTAAFHLDPNNGRFGVGIIAPQNTVDVQSSPRTGVHGTGAPLYVTGNIEEARGIEFRHSDAKQGIGFGYNTIYAAGTDANQDLKLTARGAGLVRAPGGICVTGDRSDHMEVDGGFYRHNDGQVYITVDDNLYIRDKKQPDRDGRVAFHFDTNNSRLGVGATSPQSALYVYANEQRQISTTNWADMSGNSSGWGLFATNAYTVYKDGAPRFKYANEHPAIGAIGFAVNYPEWNTASIITSGTTNATRDQDFTPKVVAKFTNGGLTVTGNIDVVGDVQASGKVTALSGITFSGSLQSANGQVTLKMHKHKKFMPNGQRHEYPVLNVKGIVITGHIRARDRIVCNDLIVGPNPKKFRIDHPLDPRRKTLTHATLEGPEAGVYYRGEGELIGGRAVIALPPYFEALTRREGRTVHITPRCEGDEPVSALAATGITDGLCTVRAIDGQNPSQRFYWEIKAVRADVPALEVERTKNSTSATDEELPDAE